jgi:hypothetical protein
MSGIHNKFLSDFISMRKELYQSTPAPTPALIAKGKKGVDSLKQAPQPEKEITLAYIIEKKPSNDKVIDYLKMRADELIAEDAD